MIVSSRLFADDEIHVQLFGALEELPNVRGCPTRATRTEGVVIKTGSFSSEASNYVRSIDPRPALIDGAQLAQFMIDFNVGVATDRAYEVK